MADPIQCIRLTHLQIPLKEPFRISGGEIALKDAILVTIETAGGRIGLGESSPMAASFGYSTDTPEGCWKDLTSRIAPRLLGHSFTHPEQIATIAADWAGCSRFAIAGAETACWDLLSQARHECLAETLGAAEDQLDFGVESGLAVGLYPSIVELLRAIEAHLVEGYKRVKIKIAPGRDIELVRAVRQHFGEELPLMIDANAAYSIADRDLFQELDAFDLLMFEQPFATADLDGLAQLQALVNTPICIDETAETPEQTAEAIRRGACKIVNIKLQRVGGFGPALAIHDLCQQQDIACWVGTMPELGVGQAQGIHLATLANCKYPTDVEPSARWFVDDIVEPLIELIAPGMLRLPADRPGLGYQINTSKLRRYRSREQEFRA